MLAELVETLTAERNLLDYLLFKLVEARLVLIADEVRFLPQAMAEVEAVVDQIRRGESHRGRHLDRLATVMGLSPSQLTLARLAEVAPEPYGLILSEHRRHFLAVTGEIERLTQENRRLASQGVASLRETLGALIGPAGAPDLYTPAGFATAPSAPPLRVDEVM
jgi:hypothetical protein